MNNCKRCGSTSITQIKDFEYKLEEDSPIKLIDVLKCDICECIHWDNGSHSFYQYHSSINDGDTTKNIKNWSTNHNT